MARGRKTRSDTRGAAFTDADVPQEVRSRVWKRSIRGICKDLVGVHSTQIAMRLREGVLTRDLRLALKYLSFVGAYESGKPVETHRMVGLSDGPSGAYDISKLGVAEQKKLLALLRAAKDDTGPKGEV